MLGWDGGERVRRPKIDGLKLVVHTFKKEKEKTTCSKNHNPKLVRVLAWRIGYPLTPHQDQRDGARVSSHGPAAKHVQRCTPGVASSTPTLPPTAFLTKLLNYSRSSGKPPQVWCICCPRDPVRSQVDPFQYNPPSLRRSVMTVCVKCMRDGVCPDGV